MFLRPVLFACFAVFAMSVCLLAASQAHAEPTVDDHAAYDALFRDKIVAVRRSREADDDRLLIEQMFEAAGTIPDSPGVQQLIYRGIYELGSSAGDFDSALYAAEMLAEQFPEDDTVDQAELTRSLDRAYRLSRGDERAELGEIYVTLLVDLAEDAIAKGEPATAAEHYRQAQSIARAIASDRMEQIERAAEELVEQVRLDQQIAQLERAVQANPANISAARDLVGLLMLEKLDAGRALAYVESTKDPDLIDVVTFAAGGVDAATPPEALRVGDWYFAAAQGADDEPAAKRLSRALDFYNRMLDAYPRDDALSQRVTTLRDQARLRLNQIRGTRSQAQPGQWTNLIETFDRERHALGPDVAVREGKLYCSQTDFILDVAPQGGYILKMQLQYLDGENGISFCLPLNGEHFSFNYSWWKHTRIHVPGAERTSDREYMLRPGREVELEIRVEPLADEQCRIMLLIDGEPVIDWSDDIDKPFTRDGPVTPERFGPAIRVSCGGNIIFNSIQYIETVEDE